MTTSSAASPATSPATAAGAAPPVDAHVHFWHPGRLSYPWLDAVPPLNRAFTADDFADAVPEPLEAVFVEAGRAGSQAADELEWVRDTARTRPWIRGAVAHVPLDDPALAPAMIRAYADDPFVVGVRHNIQDEAAGFTRGAGFRAGLDLLGRAGLPFDACVREHQLTELAELAEAYPGVRIVLDHLGKPSPGGSRADWSRALRRLAHAPNTVCKLSGLATEADPGTPAADLLALLGEALEVFGPGRCLYGGDWPVMTLATSYGQWLDLVRTALAGLPDSDAEAVLRTNAVRVYGLDRDTGTAPSATGKEPA